MPSPSSPGQRPEVLAYFAAALIFAGHLAWGANEANLALILSAAWLATLGAVLVGQRRARAVLQASRLAPVAVPFAALMAVLALSLTPWGPGGAHPVWSWAPDAPRAVTVLPYATLLEIVKLWALAAAFLTGQILGADDDRLRASMQAIVLMGCVYCVWALADHAINPTTLFGAPRRFIVERLSASFGSANTAATLFGSLTLIALADLVRTYGRLGPSLRPDRLERLALGLLRPVLGLGAALACLLLTQSRLGIAITAGLALTVLGATLALRARRAQLIIPALGAGALAAGLAVAALAQTLAPLEQRMGLLQTETLQRGQIYAAHWNAFAAAPWSGYGLGAFARINAMVMDQANAAALAPIGAAHNVYIQWLEEGGVLAAGAMFTTVAVIAVQLALNIAGRRRPRTWLVAIAAVLLLFLIHGAADYALQTPSMALFLSLLLGLGAARVPRIEPWRPRS
jgi:O-antigen ligase